MVGHNPAEAAFELEPREAVFEHLSCIGASTGSTRGRIRTLFGREPQQPVQLGTIEQLLPTRDLASDSPYLRYHNRFNNLPIVSLV